MRVSRSSGFWVNVQANNQSFDKFARKSHRAAIFRLYPGTRFQHQPSDIDRQLEQENQRQKCIQPRPAKTASATSPGSIRMSISSYRSRAACTAPQKARRSRRVKRSVDRRKLQLSQLNATAYLLGNA